MTLFVFCFGCQEKTDTESGVVKDIEGQVTEAKKTQRPNILLIVADDLGYSDLGSYGSEIATPHLDQLAEEGIKFTSFYAAPTCSPSRAMMLSGVDPHLAGLGTMAERMKPEFEGKAGYEGYLNHRVVPVSEILKEAGYHTYMTGKWHLGKSAETNPAARGFEESFVLIEGGASHLDDMPYADPEITGRSKSQYTENGRSIDPPASFYSSELYVDKLIDYLEVDKASDKPFFAYLAFTAPHFPLQAPESSRKKYAGAYDEGYDQIYTRRLQRMHDLGVIAPHAKASVRTSNQTPWEDLNDAQRAYEAKRMEVYAAMIDDMDINIGRLFDYLRQRGDFENTFIVFISDNGAEGREIDQHIKSLGTWPGRCCDNSLENMGGPGSYIWLGTNWGRVSSGPYRATKSTTAEGGIRVPAIVRFPELSNQDGIAGVFSSVLDLTPTFLDVAGVMHPVEASDEASFYPLDGSSMLPYLKGEADSVHKPDYTMGWELSGKRALRQGDWKLLWEDQTFGVKDWTLYNLVEDPGEINDLSKEQPEKMAEMLSLWEEYKTEKNVIGVNNGAR